MECRRGVVDTMTGRLQVCYPGHDEGGSGSWRGCGVSGGGDYTLQVQLSQPRFLNL